MDEGTFNMNNWKSVYSNELTSNSYKYLKKYEYDESISFYIGEYKYNLPVLDFMQSNLVKGFFQNLDNNIHKSTFGIGLILNKNKLVFSFVFDNDDIPPLFKNSSLYDSCEWLKVNLKNIEEIMYPNLFDVQNYQLFVYK